MNNLKHDIFSGGVVVSAPNRDAGRSRKPNSSFYHVPLEQPTLTTGSKAARQQFSSEIIVSDLQPSDYHEEISVQEPAEPEFATHLENGWFGFDAAIDDEKLLDKWCRIQM